MTDFEQWLQSTPEYKNLLIQHGERLFIMRDGEYGILTVRLAHRVWVLCGGLKVTVEDDCTMSHCDYMCYKAHHYLQIVIIISLLGWAILHFLNVI